MNKFVIGTALFLAVFMAVFAFSAQIAEAATPHLAVDNAGNNQVRIEVNGDINVPVYLYFYNPPNSGNIQSVGSIGSTNSSGYFTTTVNSGAYNIPAGTSVFVNVNNQQSSSAIWPTVTGGNVTLSQTNLYLSVNQSNTVSISGGTGTYYVSSNSNSNVASVSINGSILTVSAINGGSTNISICSANVGTSCATLFVTVNGYNYGGNNQVTFSQSSINVQAGQTQSVSIYGNGNYYVSGNNGSGIASVTLNGSTLTVSGIANGSATFIICSQAQTSSCGSLYVTVYSSYNNNPNYNYPCNCYNPYNNYYPDYNYPNYNYPNYNYPYYQYPSNYYYYYNYNYQQQNQYPSGFYTNGSYGYPNYGSGGGFVRTS